MLEICTLLNIIEKVTCWHSRKYAAM